MSNVLTIGFTGEGPSDNRFLVGIIRRTFEEIAFDCAGEIEVYEPQLVDKKGETFIEQILNAAKDSDKSGLLVLCIHVDSDNRQDKIVFDNKIKPAIEAINLAPEPICKVIVAIVPVQMSEAWMLADKELLIDEIGTTKSLYDLNLNRPPEAYSDPKEVIKEAIRIAYSDLPAKRRNQVSISELYLPLGQKISLESLKNLDSFNKFYNEVVQALKKLNFLH